MKKFIEFLLNLLKSVFGGKKKAIDKAPAPVREETWEEGKQGDEVRDIQKKLIHLNAEFAGGADGDLGPKTIGAIEEFKEENDIVEEGVGPETLKAIDKAHSELKIPANLEIEEGDRGEKVAEFQKKIMALGYDLPKFGADGSMGDETLVAVMSYQNDNDIRDESAFRDRGVGPITFKAVHDAKAPEKKEEPAVPKPPPTSSNLPAPPPGTVVRYHMHDLQKGSKNRKHTISELRGVVLHQTACRLGEKVHRYDNVACHVAITAMGQIIWVNNFERYVWHGHGFNRHTLGIELDGHFAGLEPYNAETGKWEPNLDTYWRPASRPDRMPVSVTPAQIEACKKVIRWMKECVDGQGGDFKYILSHRQSSGSRRTDPGEKVWRTIALPLFDELDMTDGGDDYFILDKNGRPGRPNPKEWGDRYTADFRRAPRNLKGRSKYGPKK